MDDPLFITLATLSLLVYIVVGLIILSATMNDDVELSIATSVFWPIWAIIFGVRALYRGTNKIFWRLKK